MPFADATRQPKRRPDAANRAGIAIKRTEATRRSAPRTRSALR